MSSHHSRHALYLKDREEGFDLDFGVRAKLPEYNALRDINMKHYFENRDLQKHLLNTGQIDKIGRVINLENNKLKLSIIEKEFHRAEQVEREKQRDEEEARRQVRAKRLNELEVNRKLARAYRTREDYRIQRDITIASREAKGWVEKRKIKFPPK